ncbi:hypothetical protein F5Y16DRAFT_364857 [Xylariaceae sp. FL0255]|nr:hypothetical protein F5Y16DRAFT_364857 [Xylariaceae sp. FL0255]
MLCSNACCCPCERLVFEGAWGWGYKTMVSYSLFLDSVYHHPTSTAYNSNKTHFSAQKDSRVLFPYLFFCPYRKFLPLKSPLPTINMRFTTASVVAFAIAVTAAPSPLSPDPAGTKNIGNGQGIQFIGGQCLSAADCASTCCATLGSIGICSGIGAQFQAGKTGCGFGGSTDPAGAAASSFAAAVTTTAAATTVAPAAAATTAATSGLQPDPAGAKNVGNGKGIQFIGGQCDSSADCGSGCCAFLRDIGICSGPGAQFQAGKQGCGFGDGGSTPAASSAAASTTAAAASGASTGTVTINTNDPGAENVGKGNGQQFITGQCASDADCASGCCNSGATCSSPAVAACGFTFTVSG